MYDARLEGKLSGWHGVKTQPNTLPINGMNTVPIREQEAFAGKLLHTPSGEKEFTGPYRPQRQRDRTGSWLWRCQQFFHPV